MYTKIEITGKIQVMTGMHIGGSTQFSAIGSVDAPVIRDVVSNMPMIPGSSLKGKLRTLLAKDRNDRIVEPKEDNYMVKRLFGSPNGNEKFSRLIFSDLFLSNMDDLKAKDIHSATEIKFENTINRLTAVAKPRQIERTIRGTFFNLSIIYNVVKTDEITQDFETLAKGLKLLQYDYLGGHGSRGYGKIEFSELNAAVVVGTLDGSKLEKCRALLQEV